MNYFTLTPHTSNSGFVCLEGVKPTVIPNECVNRSSTQLLNNTQTQEGKD